MKPIKQPPSMRFSDLVSSIKAVHAQCISQATRAVNISLTVRNWIIGFSITEYEQNGADRAKYGSRLLERLAETLHKDLDRCYTDRYLRLCRQFYATYPQFRKSLISKSTQAGIRKSLISELPFDTRREKRKQSMQFSAEELLTKLSFTHFIELLKCEDAVKRAFYELECVRGTWSVRELKRQMSTLYYERSGLSKNKKKLAAMTAKTTEADTPVLAVRDPYVFEFLGLKPKDVMGESHLEDALLDRLQEFLLELGHGFCFESRQKRILLDDEHAFVDLVFYHRILKCHVLIELKVDEFKHEYVGQLNTYVSWYRKNVMVQGDNPPVGILLCTQKNHAKAAYALAGMNNKLFVTKYQLQLPKPGDMQKFIENQMRNVRP
jgi:predicted nuclease of restriction endonuclease-like (RecB) superfamily